jgi:hypothetical protein
MNDVVASREVTDLLQVLTGKSQQGIEKYRGRRSGRPYTMEVEEEAVVGAMWKIGGIKQQSNLSCSYWS